MTKTKLIKHLLLTIVGVVSFQHSFCQQNYLPGYAITQKGDTLRGLINYRNRNINPTEISFKKDAASSIQILTMHDIIEFHVSDEFYKRAIVESEISSDNLNNLDLNRKLTIRTDTAFLQTLVLGSKSLYYYKNSSDKDQFYINENGKNVLLLYKRYKFEQDGQNTYFKEVNTYKGQLTLYMQDNPLINAKLKNLRYSKDQLVDLFDYYYKSTSTQPVSRKKTEHPIFEYGVTAGQTITNINFIGDATVTNDAVGGYLINTRYNKSPNLTTGLYLEIIFPQYNKKWSMYNELAYTTYKFNGTLKAPILEPTSFIYNTTIGCSNLSMTNLIRFKYPLGPVFFYLNGGLAFNLVIKEINNLNKTYENGDQVLTIFNGPAIEYTKNYNIGPVWGFGVKYQRYSIDFRYETSNGTSNYSSAKSIIKRYLMQVGVRLL
jgi:hypothetical protein